MKASLAVGLIDPRILVIILVELTYTLEKFRKLLIIKRGRTKGVQDQLELESKLRGIYCFIWTPQMREVLFIHSIFSSFFGYAASIYA